jgi:hypothetical protein
MNDEKETMRMRVMTLIAALVIAIPAAAQDQGNTAATSAAPTEATAARSGLAAPADAPAALQGTSSRGTKRKGSMVGYIEDATIRTQLRFRFDMGWGMDSPDRAEFFYGKCGCYRDLAGSPLLDPEAPGPGPGIVTGLNFNQFMVLGEYAVNGRVSIFGELPIRSLDPKSFVDGTGSFEGQSGIGDITAGVKLGLVTDENRDVTLLLRASMPSGDSLKGLGTDHASFEPALLYRQAVHDRVSIESQFGLWNPIGGSRGPQPSDDKFAGSILYYGIGPSVDAFDNGKVRFSPVVELVGWHVLKGFETKTLLTPVGGNAEGVNVVNLKFGARTSFNDSGSIYVGFGWHLTDAVWYDKIWRFEYRAGF